MEEKESKIQLYDWQLYDMLLNALLVNVYTLSKENKEIIIEDYNDKKYSHKCFLIIASYIQTLYRYPIKFKKSLIPYLFLKLKYGKRYDIRRVKKSNKSINIEKEISHIGKFFEISEESFEKMYNEFFKRSK